ncbi:MAG: apolipoprotein N-acyltransferase [Planctomycetota bacterium]
MTSGQAAAKPEVKAKAAAPESGATPTTKRAGLPWPSALGLLVLGAGLRFVVLDGYEFPGVVMLTLLCAAPTILACVEARRWWSFGVMALATEFVLWIGLCRWFTPVSPAGVWGAGAYLGVYSTLALLAVRAVGRKPWPPALTLPAVWVMFDLVRSYFPFNGFPWFYLAHGMVSARPEAGSAVLAQSAAHFGQHAVTAIAICVSAFAVQAVRRRGQVAGHKAMVASLVGMSAVVIAAGVDGNFAAQSQPGGKAPMLMVAAVQTNIPQSNRNSPTVQSLADDWEALLELTREAGRKNPSADLIVWPETSTYFPINDAAVDDAVARLRKGVDDPRTRYGLLQRVIRRQDVEQLAQELGQPILIGSSSMTPSPDDPFAGPRANSALLVRPDTGLDTGRFDKHHLVPFGEYIPGPGWLKRNLFDRFNPYDHDYTLTPGAQGVRFQVETGYGQVVTLATPICFEDVVPRINRRIARGPAVRSSDLGQNAPPADVLINLTNDGWFAGTRQPAQHLRMAALRCIELRTPMVRCVNTGITAVIRANGRVDDAAPEGLAGVHLFAVALADEAPETLYARLGDAPAWAFSAVGGLLVIVSLRPIRRTDSSMTAPTQSPEPDG